MKAFNHGPHVVLDLLSCGLWLPIHLLLWACAPTVPVGRAAFVQPQMPQTYQVQPVQPVQPPVPPQPVSQPPAWAIEAAREQLPIDAPWPVVASLAWDHVQRWEKELRSVEFGSDGLGY